ncbi:hypothetical protein [Peribacillus sp. SI8-4]|uniref:hypothetical protein n=1 Tax=Peribacillus sp. SI8-4 TaxID=3048009 RepID=UPI002554745E|nr:hypothetical protein [Peribacillus sp. SI8-4]
MRKWVYLTLYQPGMQHGWKNIEQVWRKKASVRTVTGVDTAPSYQQNIIFPISMIALVATAAEPTLIGLP